MDNTAPAFNGGFANVPPIPNQQSPLKFTIDQDNKKKKFLILGVFGIFAVFLAAAVFAVSNLNFENRSKAGFVSYPFFELTPGPVSGNSKTYDIYLDGTGAPSTTAIHSFSLSINTSGVAPKVYGASDTQDETTVTEDDESNTGETVLGDSTSLDNQVAAVISMPAREPITPTPTAIGGSRDPHGCLISGGYTWCAAKQKCLRTWEEPCPTPTPSCTPRPSCLDQKPPCKIETFADPHWCTPTPSPKVSCNPRPSCLDANPPCKIQTFADPNWCLTPTPTKSPVTPTSTPTTVVVSNFFNIYKDTTTQIYVMNATPNKGPILDTWAPPVNVQPNPGITLSAIVTKVGNPQPQLHSKLRVGYITVSANSPAPTITKQSIKGSIAGVNTDVELYQPNLKPTTTPTSVISCNPSNGPKSCPSGYTCVIPTPCVGSNPNCGGTPYCVKITPTPSGSGQISCGGKCTTNGDCKKPANGGTAVCRNDVCENAACAAGKTVPGANCDCSATERTCGQTCGASVGLCAPGFTCRFITGDTCKGNEFNNATVCIPNTLPAPWKTYMCTGGGNHFVTNKIAGNPTITEVQNMCTQVMVTKTPTPTPSPLLTCKYYLDQTMNQAPQCPPNYVCKPVGGQSGNLDYMQGNCFPVTPTPTSVVTQYPSYTPTPAIACKANTDCPTNYTCLNGRCMLTKTY